MEINFSVTKPATTVEQCQVKSRKAVILGWIKKIGFDYKNEFKASQS
jgi:hypothetical protein